MLLFDDAGYYTGFDAEQFTSRSGGKARAVQHIKEKYNYQRVVMIGDGVTDMEARPPAVCLLAVEFVVFSMCLTSLIILFRRLSTGYVHRFRWRCCSRGCAKRR